MWGNLRVYNACEKGNCDTYEKKIGSLSSSYDAAQHKWGGGWRMPTDDEFYELVTRCTWELDHNGYKVTGPNGNHIFLPAAGYKSGVNTDEVGVTGYYWSSTAFYDSSLTERENARYANALYFNRMEGIDPTTSYGLKRYIGASIRPVCDF